AEVVVGRLAETGVEMAPTPIEQIHYLELALQAAKILELIAFEQFQNDAVPLQTMRRATARRLTAKIALRRGQSAAARAMGIQPQPTLIELTNDVPNWLKERYEV